MFWVPFPVQKSQSQWIKSHFPTHILGQSQSHFTPSGPSIYQATVTTATITETYVGLATNLKEHYRNHQSSFWRSNRGNETELSKYIWTLQDCNKPFQIKWKVLKKCKAYSNISKKCNLCLYEKFIIICKKEFCNLNRRNELASSCPQRNRYVLQNSRVT